jgi:hypothetical protein
VLAVVATPAFGIEYSYQGTITAIDSGGPPLPIELGDPFAITMQLVQPVGGQAGILFTIHIDVFSWSGAGSASMGALAPQGPDELVFYSNETGPLWDTFRPSLFSLSLRDPTQTLLPHPFEFPDTAPDPALFLSGGFFALGLRSDPPVPGGLGTVHASPLALREVPPLPFLILFGAVLIGCGLRSSLSLPLVALGILLTPRLGVADAGHCVAGQTPPLKNCGTGANGLTNGSTTCKTVIVMNDTQHHVNLNPVISMALNPNGDAAILHELVDWMLQEAPSNRENVAFALHTGDIVEAAARNGINNSMPLHLNCLNPPVNGCVGYEGLTRLSPRRRVRGD